MIIGSIREIVGDPDFRRALEILAPIYTKNFTEQQGDIYVFLREWLNWRSPDLVPFLLFGELCRDDPRHRGQAWRGTLLVHQEDTSWVIYLRVGEDLQLVKKVPAYWAVLARTYTMPSGMAVYEAIHFSPHVRRRAAAGAMDQLVITELAPDDPFSRPRTVPAEDPPLYGATYDIGGAHGEGLTEYVLADQWRKIRGLFLK